MASPQQKSSQIHHRRFALIAVSRDGRLRLPAA
jgi:hypothetical protein